METWHYEDATGVPPCGSILPIKGHIEEILFWTLDGPELKGFKAGYEVPIHEQREKAG